MRTTHRGIDGRGQTTLDFAIAMGLFLLAVAFTFTFIPSMTAPFVDERQDGSVTADRVASHLSEGALGEPNRPFVVYESCATPLFAENTSVQPNCGYNGSEYKERLGVGDRISVNVSMVHVDTEAIGADRFRTVCYDADADAVTHEDESSYSCDTRYVVGDDPASRNSVTVARRIVTLPDCEFGDETETCDATLVVEVW